MAKVKVIGVEFGMSQAKGPNTWLKASAKMEIELEDGEHNPKTVDEIWEDAWNRVTEETGKQLQKLDSNGY